MLLLLASVFGVVAFCLFEFSLIGIILSLLVLVSLISVLKFGLTNETASEISFRRAENRKNMNYL